jgi:hypothetical protein
MNQTSLSRSPCETKLHIDQLTNHVTQRLLDSDPQGHSSISTLVFTGSSEIMMSKYDRGDRKNPHHFRTTSYLRLTYLFWCQCVMFSDENEFEWDKTNSSQWRLKVETHVLAFRQHSCKDLMWGSGVFHLRPQMHKHKHSSCCFVECFSTVPRVSKTIPGQFAAMAILYLSKALKATGVPDKRGTGDSPKLYCFRAYFGAGGSPSC